MVTREGILNADDLKNRWNKFDVKMISSLYSKSTVCLSSKDIIHEVLEVCKHVLIEHAATLCILL
jgi:hypothetical protein